MNKIIIVLMAILVLLVACEEIPSEPIVTEKECTIHNDCITGGCSGTICQSKNEEPIFTTCEYLPEYACYKEIDCSCIDGKCQWDKTNEFNKCVEKARKSEIIAY
jgi:eight-cysteine-cluster-containing protein